MNAMQAGIMLYQEIESVRTNGKWKLEKRLPGPLSCDEVDIICRMAGCWCDIPAANVGEEVKFYTNQNHPEHGGRP